jgi:excisionase family DNA binding protein
LFATVLPVFGLMAVGFGLRRIQWLTQEADQRLRLSVERVRELVHRGRIPCIRLNSRTWRFHWPTVLAALQR